MPQLPPPVAVLHKVQQGAACSLCTSFSRVQLEVLSKVQFEDLQRFSKVQLALLHQKHLCRKETGMPK